LALTRRRSALAQVSGRALSADVGRAAAEALHARGELPALEPVLPRELRMLNRSADGLARALRLAEARPTPAVKQALLWSSWNQSECAPDCARLLLRLASGSTPLEPMAGRRADPRPPPRHVPRKAASHRARCR